VADEQTNKIVASICRFIYEFLSLRFKFIIFVYDEDVEVEFFRELSRIII
jgi:hypothetical protein